MSLKEDAILVGGIGLGIVCIAWYLQSRLSNAAGSLADGVSGAAGAAWDVAGDVASSVYGGVSDGATVIWDTTTTVVGAVGTGINPANPGNIINRGVNGVGSAVTGRDWSLGTQIYDWLN